MSDKYGFYFPLRSADMDPHNVFTPVRACVTETLLNLDEDSNIEGWLAEKWETSDNTKWVFTIREGITFQNGAKLDAKAVQKSLEKSMEANESLSASLKIKSMEAQEQTLSWSVCLSTTIHSYISMKIEIGIVLVNLCGDFQNKP